MVPIKIGGGVIGLVLGFFWQKVAELGLKTSQHANQQQTNQKQQPHSMKCSVDVQFSRQFAGVLPNR
jgi:hypothetical protein